jgi:hypothetical protein
MSRRGFFISAKEILIMTKHSPSPFLVEYSPFKGQHGNEIPSFRIHDAEGNPVAETDSGKPESQQEADALLMAAAPDMLDALEFVCMTFADMEASKRKGYYTDCPKIVATAIAKAKGGAA